MAIIGYHPFDAVSASAMADFLNQPQIRTHLIEHPLFDEPAAQSWMNSKQALDQKPGCRLRLVFIDGEFAGWCGIQPDEQGVELAIVIAPGFWGAGIRIFKTMLQWASELRHEWVVFHLLDSRKQYRALAKLASRVERHTWEGREFRTYVIEVK